MKHLLPIFLSLSIAMPSLAQSDRDKAVMKEYTPGYYQNTILKDLNEYKEKQKTSKKRNILKADMTGKDFPKDLTAYEQVWHNKPVSQGSTGTCWCFSTTSFYESEVKRIAGKEVRLSEMYTVYWEYIERARYFVEQRGKMSLGEGSETNAVARMMTKYGIVPWADYNGMKDSIPFHSHGKMFDEINSYLKGVKERSAWNTEEVIATTKSILNHHMGVPPTEVMVKGKSLTPQEYLTKELQLKTTEYVDFMSLMEKPYNQKVEYDVPDNWWNSEDYYNVPLTDFVSGIKNALKKGYSISIGGDVSEPGFERENQVAIVPSFDIPSEYIDESARQFRFYNRSTTDDHAMHVVGWQDREDGAWFLVKDSGSGSRSCGPECKEFGYYFFHQDYIKLKMMSFTVHRDAVSGLLKEFKAQK